MLGDLESESFANVSSRITASFDQNGTDGTANTGVTAAIFYNSATDSYTLTTTGGSITFLPGDIDQSQSTADVIVYIRTAGDTTQSLTLTRAGTSGPLRFQYVGAAFWQTTQVASATRVNGSIDAIVYGIPAPAAIIPRTGSADFDVDLIGAVTQPSFIQPLAGTGTASVDFASGTIIFLGTFDISIPFAGAFLGIADIASGTNAFSGTFEFEVGAQYRGALEGLFFGPNAEEIGATFSARFDPDGTVAAGALLGRRSGSAPANTTFGAGTFPTTDLPNSQTFVTSEAVLDTTITGTDGFIEQLGAFSNIADRDGDLVIRYDADEGVYLLISSDFNPAFDQNGVRIETLPNAFSNATLNTFQFNQRFTVPQPEYVRLREWSTVVGSASGQSAEQQFSFHVFGFETADAALGRTGTGGYRIQVAGRAIDTEFRNTMGFAGLGELFVDFASGDITAFSELDFGEQIVNAALTPETRNGSFRFNGALASNENAFNGTVTIDGIGAYTGTGSGSFFGPNAEEVGGVFTASEGPNGALAGGFFGLRDDSVTNPNTGSSTLAALTGTQALPFFVIEESGFNLDVNAFRFNNDTGRFEVDLGIIGSTGVETIAWTPTDASAEQTSPALDGFLSVFNDQDIRLRVPGQTPPIELTYASFAEISRPDFPAPNFDERAFLVYGLQTRQMPRTGTGTYSGITIASAEVSVDGAVDLFLVNGTSLLTADFGAGTFDLLLSNLVGTFEDDRGLGRTNNFDGIFDDIQYQGEISGSELIAFNQANFRTLKGGFFGPNAEEFAAVFETTQGNAFSSIGTGAIITGVATGKRN